MSKLRLINAVNNAIYMTTEQFQYSCSLFCEVAHTKLIYILEAVDMEILCLYVTIVRFSVNVW